LLATVRAICDIAVNMDEISDIMAGMLSELNFGLTTSIAPKNATQILIIFALAGLFLSNIEVKMLINIEKSLNSKNNQKIIYTIKLNFKNDY